MLRERVWGRNSKLYLAAFEFIKVRGQNLDITEDERLGLRKDFCQAFQMSEEELQHELAFHSNGNAGTQTHVAEEDDPATLEKELLAILPQKGLVRNYVDYTIHSEAPLAYHVFSCLCGIGAVVNRRVWIDMGYFRIFPAMGIIILGPSGVKKTSATDIIVDILNEIGLVRMYSEKLTPEALIDSMKQDAVGMLYAPEMVTFLNKVKYNEGMIQIITRFMDCPSYWESGTIMRGKHVLRNIAISSLMCSTPDWFIHSTPEDSFRGGFIARNLLVIQTGSPRCEPIPRPGSGDDRNRFVVGVAGLHELEGEIVLANNTLRAYDEWYRTEHQIALKSPEHELLVTYYNRKPAHVFRVAICLHLAEHGTLTLCLDCYQRALQLLNWVEKFVPSLLQQMFKSSAGEEQESVLRVVRAHGIIKHTDLIRRLGYKFNASQVRSIIQSLKEQELVEERNDALFGHVYQAKEGGNGSL